MPTEFFRPKWHHKDLIRNITTGKPMFVLHVFTDTCTLLADLESPQILSQPVILLPRDYEYWALDRDMHCVEKREKLEWSYKPATI